MSFVTGNLLSLSVFHSKPISAEHVAGLFIVTELPELGQY